MYSILAAATSFTSPGENFWPSNWMWEDTHSSTRHSRNTFYKRTHVNYNFMQKDCNTNCKSCLRTTSNMVISLSVFKGSTIFIQVMLLSLQALGFADSHHPGNHGGQATPPIAPGRSRGWLEQRFPIQNMFDFGPFVSKKTLADPNCTSNTSPSIICLAC